MVEEKGQNSWKTRPEWLMLNRQKKCENLVELFGSFLSQVIRGGKKEGPAGCSISWKNGR